MYHQEDYGDNPLAPSPSGSRPLLCSKIERHGHPPDAELVANEVVGILAQNVDIRVPR